MGKGPGKGRAGVDFFSDGRGGDRTGLDGGVRCGGERVALGWGAEAWKLKRGMAEVSELQEDWREAKTEMMLTY